MIYSCATCEANETSCRDWRFDRVEHLPEITRKRLPKDLQDKPWMKVIVCADCHFGNDCTEPYDE